MTNIAPVSLDRVEDTVRALEEMRREKQEMETRLAAGLDIDEDLYYDRLCNYGVHTRAVHLLLSCSINDERVDAAFRALTDASGPRPQQY